MTSGSKGAARAAGSFPPHCLPLFPHRRRAAPQLSSEWECPRDAGGLRARRWLRAPSIPGWERSKTVSPEMYSGILDIFAALETEEEWKVPEFLYPGLQPVNSSHSVLAKCERMLGVPPASGLQWSDRGGRARRFRGARAGPDTQAVRACPKP